MKLHINKGTLSRSELFHNRADILLGHVDDNVLDRLALYAVDLLVKHTGIGATKLVALAAHIFDKNGKVHFSSTRYAEGVGGITILDTEGYVTKKLLVKAGTKVTRGNEFTLLSRERRIVYGKGHFHCGLANLDKLEGLYLCGGADGVTDRDILASREADDVANLCLGNGNTLESIELIDGYDL